MALEKQMSPYTVQRDGFPFCTAWSAKIGAIRTQDKYTRACQHQSDHPPSCSVLSIPRHGESQGKKLSPLCEC